jgi:hypothetical protein
MSRHSDAILKFGDSYLKKASPAIICGDESGQAIRLATSRYVSSPSILSFDGPTPSRVEF